MTNLDVIINGDSGVVPKGLPDESVDCMVTDPPYGLTSPGAKNATGGFMGKTSDKFRTHKESEEDRLRCEWNLKAARDSHDALSRDNQKLKLQLAELQEKYAALQQKEGWWRKFAVGVEVDLTDLSWAHLCIGNIPQFYILPDIYSIKMQQPDTKLRFWKYLIDGISPYQSASYEVGGIYEFSDADIDENVTCAPGGNVATLSRCLKDGISANEFIEVEFAVKDIAAIPFASDGKFRVRWFRVLRKIDRESAMMVITAAMNGG